MWICAACGTEAQQPDMCSGCGSLMRPFNEPKEVKYQFVLIVHRHRDDDSAVYGPFPSVMSADQWADGNLDHHDYEVVLMEAPNGD